MRLHPPPAGNLAALLALVLSLAGCAPQRPPAPQTGGSAAGTPTPTPSAAAAESTPEAGGGFRRWEVSAVLAAFKGARLEAEGARGVEAVAAAGSAEAAEFAIPSVGAGGRVLSFRSAESLEAAVQAYAGAGEFSWVYVKDNVLVRLDGRVPEETARRYEAALAAMQ